MLSHTPHPDTRPKNGTFQLDSIDAAGSVNGRLVPAVISSTNIALDSPRLPTLPSGYGGGGGLTSYMAEAVRAKGGRPGLCRRPGLSGVELEESNKWLVTLGGVMGIMEKKRAKKRNEGVRLIKLLDGELRDNGRCCNCIVQN